MQVSCNQVGHVGSPCHSLRFPSDVVQIVAGGIVSLLWHRELQNSCLWNKQFLNFLMADQILLVSLKCNGIIFLRGFKVHNALNKYCLIRCVLSSTSAKQFTCVFHLQWISSGFLPRGICVNPWCVNCFCRCVQLETPHFKVWMLWMGQDKALCQCYLSMFVRLAKGRCFNLDFPARGKKPAFYYCLCWVTAVNHCVCALRENVFTKGSKSNSSRCFLLLSALSAMFNNDFPVLGALKAF